MEPLVVVIAAKKDTLVLKIERESAEVTEVSLTTPNANRPGGTRIARDVYYGQRWHQNGPRWTWLFATSSASPRERKRLCFLERIRDVSTIPVFCHVLVARAIHRGNIAMARGTVSRFFETNTNFSLNLTRRKQRPLLGRDKIHQSDRTRSLTNTDFRYFPRHCFTLSRSRSLWRQTDRFLGMTFLLRRQKIL